MEITEGYKFHVQFHITNRCNLRCKHCYEGKQTNIVEWELDEFKNAIDKLWNCFAKWNVKGEISIIGGEPTLHPKFKEIVEYLGERGDVETIAILTNGVSLDEDFIEVAKRYHCHVQVSIDGVNEQSHDDIRGHGTCKKTLENARRLYREGISVSAHTVLSKHTYPITDDFFEMVSDNGISELTFSRLVPFGNAGIEDMLSVEETKEVYEAIEKKRKEYTKLYVSSTRPLWCLLGYDGKCPVGIQTITIIENGDIMPCRRLPIIIGNIKIDNFYKVWYTSEVLENLRNRKQINKCGTCKYLDMCSGARCIAYAVNGDYMSEDPQCWMK